MKHAHGSSGFTKRSLSLSRLSLSSRLHWRYRWPLPPVRPAPPVEELPAQRIERELREHRARAAEHRAEREVRARRVAQGRGKPG